MRIERKRETNPKKLYEKDKKILQSTYNRYNRELEKAIQQLHETRRRYGLRSVEYREDYMEVQRWQYNIDEVSLQAKFIRPNKAADIAYRNQQFRRFVPDLCAVTSSKLDLRFHGTPIYFAEQIIKSGSISSSADRYNGFVRSTDVKGEISASTLGGISKTVTYYADLTAYERSLPCGCVFALFPKGRKDEKLRVMESMQSVDLRRNPNQLFGIFTTPENKSRVQGWMEEARLNASRVYTFGEFIEEVYNKSILLDSGKVKRAKDLLLEPAGFDRDEMQRMAQGRNTKNLSRLQSGLRGIFSRGQTRDFRDGGEYR